MLARMPAPEMFARFPIPPNAMPQIPPELLAGLTGMPAGPMPIFGGPFVMNGVAASSDPKKSAEYEKRQVGIRLLQTGLSLWSSSAGIGKPLSKYLEVQSFLLGKNIFGTCFVK